MMQTVAHKPGKRQDPDFIPQWKKNGKTSWTTKRVCGAATRQHSPNGPAGAPCQRPAGWGTDHSGYGKCKLHGGNAPSGRMSAVREEATDMIIQVMGPAVEIDPMDALLWCVRISAGEVAYSTWRISQLEHTDATGHPEQVLAREGGRITEERTIMPVELNIWIKTRREATDRLAKYSKAALDAGIAVRQINLAEQAGNQMATVLRKILDGLNLSADQEQKAPEIVRSALAEMEVTPVETTIAALPAAS